jgi:hypothetical protein
MIQHLLGFHPVLVLCLRLLEILMNVSEGIALL